MKASYDPLEACDLAAQYLRDAGFQFAVASMKSTSCYYSLPGRIGTIRVSIHSRKKDRKHQHTHGPVHAQVTFPPGCISKDGYVAMKIMHMTASAIGIFMIRAARVQP